MSKYKTLFLCMTIAVACTTFGYWLANQRTIRATTAVTKTRASTSMERENKKILYWYDPMVPAQHFDRPGKSPFMDMELVPKYANDSDTAGLLIPPRMQQNLAIRRASVERLVIPENLDAVGSLVFNQRNVAIVQARSNGFVERVYALAVGDIITKNAPLADLVLPEWTGAQAEYLVLRHNSPPELKEAARQRLYLQGMSEELIRQVESTGKPLMTVTINSPVEGMIQALDVRSGMTVSMGTTLVQIAGIDPVWLEVALPEAESESVNVGQPLEAVLIAYPGKTFKGQVIAVLPETSTETHTLKIRAEFPNPEQKLRPGMYAQVRIDVTKKESLLWVPTEAVIRTGKRTVVIVDKGEDHFLPVDIVTGRETSGKTSVSSGLQEGQTVVTSGQFLIDSEANLTGVLAALQAKSDPASADSEKKRMTKTGKQGTSHD